MELVSLSPGLGRYFGTDEGLLIVRAPDNEEIGLEDGDVIRMIGTRKPNDPGHAMRILRSYEPGEELVIQILRETESREVRLTLPQPPERTGSFFSTPEGWNPGNWLRSPGRI
jgi:S1-C subfamily serine protease